MYQSTNTNQIIVLLQANITLQQLNPDILFHKSKQYAQTIAHHTIKPFPE